MHSAQFAQLDEIGGGHPWRAGEMRPAGFGRQTIATDIMCHGASERAHVCRSSQIDHRGRWRGEPKSSDGAGRGGVGEGVGGRLDHGDTRAPEMLQKQLTDEAAVVHVQPLGGGDVYAEVSRSGQQRGRQEEMHVQPGKLTGPAPQSRRLARQPQLGRRRD